MAGSILGNAVLRVEDPRFLAGEARYVENIALDGAQHAVFVRSFLAHARVNGIDATQARTMPGVSGVWTAGDLELPPMGVMESVGEGFARPVLARDVVRFVGESVAIVVAGTRAEALDAAEAVIVDYDPLPVRGGSVGGAWRRARRCCSPSTARTCSSTAGAAGIAAGALEGADVVVRARFVNQRVAPVPMEANGALAAFDPETEGLRLWVPSQAPFAVRAEVAEALGLDADRVHVIAPDVGGGFGAKGDTYPEWVALAAIAVRTRGGRPLHGDAVGEPERDGARPGADPGRGDRRAARRDDRRSSGRRARRDGRVSAGRVSPHPHAQDGGGRVPIPQDRVPGRAAC